MLTIIQAKFALILPAALQPTNSFNFPSLSMRATFNTTANPAVADVQGEANACLSALETFVENSNEVYESPSLVLHHLCLLKWCMEENERLDRETILGLEATNKKLLEAHAAMHWYSWMTCMFCSCLTLVTFVIAAITNYVAVLGFCFCRRRSCSCC